MTTKGQSNKGQSGKAARYEALLARRPFAKVTQASRSTICARAATQAAATIDKECATKQNVLPGARSCHSGGGGATPVDLVIVIDTSGSMSDEATALSNAAAAAIKSAAAKCPSDLKVAWFGIEGTWNGTNFSTKLRDYLLGLPGVNAGDLVGTLGDREDGAAAIIDVSDHYNWRTDPGTVRAIFYLGDEALEGGNPQDAADVAAATAAINAANAGGVIVHTYFGTGGLAATEAEYKRVATKTGGQAFKAPVANLGGFEAVLEQVICGSQSRNCHEADIPNLAACFEIRWGDGTKDQLETADYEVLCVTACNPYSNVELSDLTVLISAITDPAGKPVPTLPDGSLAVDITPSEMICFGDLAPCDESGNGTGHCSTRQIALHTLGASPGTYRFHILYCFTAKLEYNNIDRFEFDLVKS